MHAALVLSALVLCLTVHVHSRGALKNFGNGFQANGGVFGQFGYASGNILYPPRYTPVGGPMQTFNKNAWNGISNNNGYYNNQMGPVRGFGMPFGGIEEENSIGTGPFGFNTGPGITSAMYQPANPGRAFPVGRYTGENDNDDLDGYDDYMRGGRYGPRRFLNDRRNRFPARMFPRFPGMTGNDDNDLDIDDDFDDLFDDDFDDDDDDDILDELLDDLFDDDDDFDDLFDDDFDDDDLEELFLLSLRRRGLRGFPGLRDFPTNDRRERYRGLGRMGGFDGTTRYPNLGVSGGISQYGGYSGMFGRSGRTSRYGEPTGYGRPNGRIRGNPNSRRFGFSRRNMDFPRPGRIPYRGSGVGRYAGEENDIEGIGGPNRREISNYRSYGNYNGRPRRRRQGGSNRLHSRPRVQYYKCKCQKKCPKYKINTGKCKRCKKKKKCKLFRCCLRRRIRKKPKKG
ncbi:putative carbonic anhydrase 2 [Ruditapes philippinarum]|uniref:putative carbonic anhydrase 2 n=1 Tax=Ruditapes philippinarum TaxID=129788 RepID=UPI00295B8F15|nr:putative carbonic anhydrase 2 [Ruditapes philippinarum]